MYNSNQIYINDMMKTPTAPSSGNILNHSQQQNSRNDSNWNNGGVPPHVISPLNFNEQTKGSIGNSFLFSQNGQNETLDVIANMSGPQDFKSTANFSTLDDENKVEIDQIANMIPGTPNLSQVDERETDFNPRSPSDR